MAVYQLKHFNKYINTAYRMYSIYGKRFFDVFLAVFALSILSPIILFVAVTIYFFDSGPVFFKQERIGKKGKKFLIFKFRSMPVQTKNLPSDQIGTVQLTSLGMFIRKSNLDELPQFFNILRNEMSIVGPRPCMTTQKKLIELRRKNSSWFCKPGLTGLAQVMSFDGMSIEKKAELDKIYAKKISLWNDLKIIFKTFLYLLKTPPTY